MSCVPVVGQKFGPALRAQLYSGSADGSVRVWDLASGQCTSVVDVGGEVDSLLLEGGFLFVGLHVQAAGARQGLVKARLAPSGLTSHSDRVVQAAGARQGPTKARRRHEKDTRL